MSVASARHIDNDGNTTITVENWPDAFAGANQQPRKFAVENNGGRVLGASPGPASGLQVEIGQVGSNDGSGMLRIAADTDTVIPPYSLTAVLGGAGGAWGATGTRGWKVTATNANGETIGSFEATFNVSDITKKVTLTWTTVTGATGYKVYRTSTPGTYTGNTLRATLGVTGTFDDDGSAVTTGVIPSTNTTGGWKLTSALGGAGGVWGSTGNRFWTIAAYDATGVLIAVSLEASFNVTDTSKKVSLSWVNVAAADHYILYRSTTTGVYSDPALRTTLAGGTTTFDDDGTAVTTGALTAGPSYGIPPSLTSATPLNVTNLAIGQQFFYWVNRVISGATSESGNPRAALVTLREF